jgi:hypothetical protein
MSIMLNPHPNTPSAVRAATRPLSLPGRRSTRRGPSVRTTRRTR